jgi:hypothetical protein
MPMRSCVVAHAVGYFILYNDIAYSFEKAKSIQVSYDAETADREATHRTVATRRVAP